jgi:Uma2 family endonuclease
MRLDKNGGLIMGSLAEEKRYAYKDYITWDDQLRYELIDGIAYAMASPSRLHQKISGEIFRQFANFLKGRTCEVFHAPFDVRLNADSFDDTVVQPDILIVCDKSKLNNRGVKGAPDMIIEILSPHNIRHDTFVKFRLYQKAGVKEYWIIDINTKTVQVYISENGKYGIGRVYRDNDIIPVDILEGCQINLADVFYDAIESESESENSELIATEKIIKALRKNGMSDSQIEKIIDSIDI